MDIAGYLDEVRAKYATGLATEHSYRAALEALFRSIDPTLEVINEPRRVEVGAPDFVFNRGPVSIGWAEAKDVGKDLRFKTGDYSKEQKDRYLKGLPNLIYTNGLDFEFYRDGARINAVSIADFLPTLPPKPDRFDELARNLRSFAQQTPVSIKSAAKLASLIAGKAAIIKDVLGNLLKEDAEFRSALGRQYKAFKASLLPNLDPAEFADIYAETITYGMFAARLHDTSLGTFSRAEALELLPRSNPFLRSLFSYIAGPELDDRIAWIIDDLADILRASDPFLLFKDFGKFTARNDPFVHFYEDFLKEYNPKKRKSRGVWYTPEAVVDFIVRAVDDVLKTEFGLADGLADTSKVTIDHDTGETHPKTGKPVTVKREVHRVQILDPATGTGTFLAKTIQTIAARVKARAPGKWSGYVEHELIPRLHGFELLMASYAMCHMKLDMMLRDTGYVRSAKPPPQAERLSIWLTNALEPGEREVRDLFFTALADEARGASEVKRNKPIMCVIGNPPYSGESANKGAWIMDLMDAYKREPGGQVRLQERNPKWINDDYVKFIRMAEHLIAKNGKGLLAFITNHSYLDNPTFRGMRWHLLDTFDTIHVVDLHGNSKKFEVSPDGSPDKNVFDIQQGVAVIVAVKTSDGASTLASARHGEIWGDRASKYETLWSETHQALADTLLPNRAPQFPFVVRNSDVEAPYLSGFSLADLFPAKSVGIVTARDSLTIDVDRTALWERVQEFRHGDVEEMRRKYALGADVQDWSVADAQADLAANLQPENLIRVAYRPLDLRWTYFTGTAAGFHCRPRSEVMRHLAKPSNLALQVSRQRKSPGEYSNMLVHEGIAESSLVSNKTSEIGSSAPLYLYPQSDVGQHDAFLSGDRTLNFNPKIYAAICNAAGLTPSPDAGAGGAFRTVTGDERPAEVRVFDYIYGVLHSPAYRENYAEFLKIDFPRIPYPRDPEMFAHVSEKGEALRRLHLMEPATIGDTPYPFTGEGDDVVAPGYPKFEKSSPERGGGSPSGLTEGAPSTGFAGPPPRSGEDLGKVHINSCQYFEAVPAIAWTFPIGGYQPAQKWLKDRRGRTLSWSDIGHYQKIVKILVETDRIMKEIELPLD